MFKSPTKYSGKRPLLASAQAGDLGWGWGDRIRSLCILNKYALSTKLNHPHSVHEEI